MALPLHVGTVGTITFLPPMFIISIAGILVERESTSVLSLISNTWLSSLWMLIEVVVFKGLTEGGAVLVRGKAPDSGAWTWRSPLSCMSKSCGLMSGRLFFLVYSSNSCLLRKSMDLSGGRIMTLILHWCVSLFTALMAFLVHPSGRCVFGRTNEPIDRRTTFCVPGCFSCCTLPKN